MVAAGQDLSQSQIVGGALLSLTSACGFQASFDCSFQLFPDIWLGIQAWFWGICREKNNAVISEDMEDIQMLNSNFLA